MEEFNITNNLMNEKKVLFGKNEERREQELIWSDECYFYGNFSMVYYFCVSFKLLNLIYSPRAEILLCPVSPRVRQQKMRAIWAFSNNFNTREWISLWFSSTSK